MINYGAAIGGNEMLETIVGRGGKIQRERLFLRKKIHLHQVLYFRCGALFVFLLVFYFPHQHALTVAVHLRFEFILAIFCE